MTPGLLGISLTICILLGYSAMQYAGVAGIAGGVIMGIFMAFLARWKFKYTTGDVLGATNELSRMSALLAMVLILTMW
jgi:adenosylcobinamide-GDP ribazoletransferase